MLEQHTGAHFLDATFAIVSTLTLGVKFIQRINDDKNLHC